MAGSLAIDLMDLSAFEEGRDHHLFRQLREQASLHWTGPPGKGGFWSVTRHADIRAIAADHETFSSAHGTQIADHRAEGAGAPSIHNMDPPGQGPLRRLVVPHFRPARVRSLEPEITQIIDELLDQLQDEAAGPANFVAAVAARLPLLVVGRLLGAPAQDCPDLLTWTNAIASEDPEYSSGPDDASKARDAMFGYFRDLEQARRRAPRDDLVTALGQAEVDGRPLTRGQLDAYYLLLLVAGNETTRNLLSGGVLAFSQFPGEWDALAADPGRIPAAVEEMARWVSPVLHMRRTATRDVRLHSDQIRAGQKVVLWFCSANRDERVFADPDRFIGNRSPNDHLGYGWGVHACLGAHLARLEAGLFLRRLIQRGLRIEVQGEPARLRSNFFRGIKRLPVRLATDRG